MDLKTVRDLVNSISGGLSFSEKQLTMYINAAQMLLDQMIAEDLNRYKITKTVTAGQYIVKFPLLVRVVNNVFLFDTSDNKLPLRKKDYKSLIANYPDPDDTDGRATPKFYALIPSWVSLTSDNVSYPTDLVYPYGYGGQQDSTYDYTGIMIAPTPDIAYTAYIHARVYARPLLNPGDKSYWTLYFPTLLADATMYKLERALRNYSSAEAILKNIKMDIEQQYFDKIEDEFNDSDLDLVEDMTDD
jgi:hypothetical protein